MKLRIWLLLTLVGSYPLLGFSADEKLPIDVELGSGVDDADTDTETDTDTDLIYIDGSGSTMPDDDDKEDGSGALFSTQRGLFSSTMPTYFTKNNMACAPLFCWCIYDDGTRVENTIMYSRPAEGCEKFASVATTSKPATSKSDSSTPFTIPVRSSTPVKDVPQENVVPERTETESTNDWEFEEKTAPTTTRKTLLKGSRLTAAPPPPSSSPSTPSPVPSSPKTSTMNNKITVAPKVIPVDEVDEEETNVIGGDNNGIYSAAVYKQEASSGSLIFEHPGILAAIIGGGVVGLLCAILLIMFIVYRMRKKDEGSYPLNDTKPLKNYAYAKAPSKEFYA